MAQPARILVVEDERIIAEDIQSTLINFQYEIIGILSTGEEAIELLKKEKADLILMDIMLEGEMNGLQTAEYIHQHHVVPIVFLTAYANEKIFAGAAASDPYGYLLKPFEERELHATIEMAFYKFKMEQKLRESEQFMRTIIDTDPNIIFVKDKVGKYVLVNSSMAKLYETTPDDMVGKTDLQFAEENVIKIEDAETYFNEDLMVLDSGNKLETPEKIFTLNSGKKKYFQSTKVPLSFGRFQHGILGVAVDVTARKKAEDQEKLSFEKIENLLRETINALTFAVEMRDEYTAGHQRRVAQLAEAIALELGVSQDVLDGVVMAAVVHDIGKLKVPSDILTKPGKLSDIEFSLIKTHPKTGYDILCSISFPWPVADIVLQHHERIDGSSYPNGLKGDEILYEAKIIMVADAMEAMASHRPYRPSLGVPFALSELQKYKGKYYDSEVVDVCVELFENKDFQFK
jgi:PAS domain S-box-containing protein/putative nucleotidyltransferase with HDIG domain